MRDFLLRAESLSVRYPVRTGLFSLRSAQTVKAVDSVSLDVRPGEILGLVGESGCGKSSLGRALLRLQVPVTGRIIVDGIDFTALKGRALRQARQKIQMIFQDPYASLNPRMTVFEILYEPLDTHAPCSRRVALHKISQTLDRVGLSSRSLWKYPHEFSGGQRQRIAIARALIVKPKIIIADEPVSALDVSVQAQILNLLKEIQRDFGLAMIFISHNLAVVRYISDRIAVMYLGRIVELANRDELYREPLHPYTQVLVSSVPIPDPHLERSRIKVVARGELPSPIHPPEGCAFHTRCPLAFDRCRAERPELTPIAGSRREARCFAIDRFDTKARSPGL